jgi:hypothetical protein
MGIAFNVGYAAIVPAGANPTPIPFAILDGISFDVKPEYETYDGQYLFPKVVALKKAKCTGKIDTINVYAGALANIFGVTPSTGSLIPVVNEIKLNLAGATYTVATPGTGIGSEVFVLNLTDGILMQRVPSGPAVGQYSVVLSTGVFTFNASDNTKNFSFTYSSTSASVGKTTLVQNATGSIVTGVQLVGFAPSTSGKPIGLKAWNAYLDGYSLAFKADSFVKEAVSFFCAEDQTTGNVLTQWTGE